MLDGEQGDNFRDTVVSSLLGDSHLFDADETGIICIRNIVCVAGDLATKDDAAIANLVSALPHGDSLHAKLNSVSNLVQQMVQESDLLDDEGKQYVVTNPAGQKEALPFATRLLASIYQAQSPRSHNVLWAQTGTLRQELELFFQRIQHYPNAPYALIGVDRLSTTLREWIIRQQQSLEGHMSDVYYVQLESQTLPGSDAILPFTDDLQSLEELNPIFAESAKIQTHVVFGPAGSGKSHVARQRIQAHCRASTVVIPSVSISINENLERMHIIKQLLALPSRAAVHFNVSSLAVLRDEDNLSSIISVHPDLERFFYDLLVIGTLRDDSTQFVYTIPPRSTWFATIEWPFEYSASSILQIAAKGCDDTSTVNSEATFAIESTELKVCQYLVAFLDHPTNARPIDALMKQGRASANDKPVVISPLRDPESETTIIQCRQLLGQLFSQTRHARSSLVQKTFFLRLLSERFAFFESPIFQYNISERGLGSTMMSQFIEECDFLCQQHLKCQWITCDTAFIILSSGASGRPLPPREDLNLVPTRLRQTFDDGIKEMRSKLHAGFFNEHILAWMLNINNDEVIRNTCKAKQFVLTGDFVFKIFLIHQRKLAHLPVVIEGLLFFIIEVDSFEYMISIIDFSSNLLTYVLLQARLDAGKPFCWSFTLFS